MSARLSARTVTRLVRFGQRWARRRDRTVIVIFQIHRAERNVEAHLDGDDPRVPGTRFLVTFAELGTKYRLLDDTHRGGRMTATLRIGERSRRALGRATTERPEDATAAVRLPCRIRLADGRVFSGELPAARQRAIQLAMLHGRSAGFVELTPGTRPPGEKIQIDRRWRREHFLPGGATGDRRWLERLLAHAQRIVDGAYAEQRFDDGPREEAFVGVTPRRQPRGTKDAVTATRWLWIDVDRPDQLSALWALLAERPCHCLVESAGSGGVHCYWRLNRAIEAVRVNEGTGELIEVIERANARLIHRLGVDADGRPTVADPACQKRSQPMRLAGTINYKSGRYARIMEADLALPPYRPEALVGDLPDPPWITTRAARALERAGEDPDPYKRIPPPAYFEALAGISVPPRGGLVHCPARWHQDRHPSCSVGADPQRGWCCHGSTCQARGAIYDLASVLVGGPWGRELRGENFKRARELVVDTFGEQ